MSVIYYTPPIGEGGYVSDVEWDKPRFHYNSPYGDLYYFDETELRLFLKKFHVNANEEFQIIT